MVILGLVIPFILIPVVAIIIFQNIKPKESIQRSHDTLQKTVLANLPPQATIRYINDQDFSNFCDDFSGALKDMECYAGENGFVAVSNKANFKGNFNCVDEMGVRELKSKNDIDKKNFRCKK